MDLNGKKIVVAGLKRSGVALCEFLVRRGADVTVTDLSEKTEIGDFVRRVSRLDISLELGEHRTKTFTSADMVVLSPGVPHTIAPVKAAVECGIEVIGEVELAFRFITTPIIAVTGTNGKTTTTELLAEMFRRDGRKVFMGGNIGNPLIGYAAGEQDADIVVAEVSSFQLDTASLFKPAVGILLNITDDHLDRYENFDAYAASKMRLFAKQTEKDTAVINAVDPVVKPHLLDIRSRRLNFNAKSPGEYGAAEDGDVIICRLPGPSPYRVDVKKRRLMGRHNMENIKAACLGALAAGCSVSGIEETINGFSGLPHRMEYVDTVGGIAYYNDSKATNVDAVAKAVEAFDAPVVLLMGGRDKGGNFNLLADVVSRRARQLIVMGEAAQTISAALEPYVSTSVAADMADAVVRAAKAAAPGDMVLLSPGCASFDMFRSYAHRGDVFKQEVKLLGA